MTTIIYGIAKCSTVQKARNWLTAHQIHYIFHDFKKQGASLDKVSHWLSLLGNNKLINRQGLTWRNLSEADKIRANDAQEIVNLLIERPTLMKRPILEHDQKILCGFDENHYQALFK